jgi:predicted regulator of Ras-like GTPase activity (Roadblock/LC7/MglB family)
MSAVLVGSAETALLELGRDAARRTITEAGSTRVVAAGVNAELLLVAVSDLSLPVQELLGSVDEAAQTLAKVAAGG